MGDKVNDLKSAAALLTWLKKMSPSTQQTWVKKDRLKLLPYLYFYLRHFCSPKQYLIWKSAQILNGIVSSQNSNTFNPIPHGHGPLWPMLLKICMPYLHFLSQTHKTSWLCSFWYLSRSSKATFDIFCWKKLKN